MTSTTVAETVNKWFGRRERRPVVGPLDGLTGLARRDDLLARGAELLAAADEAGGPAALLLLDLDGFKGVNDAAGHHVGDRVLAAVGARLTVAVHPEDLVVRLGGDEFAILTCPLADPADGIARAKAVIDAVGTPIEIDDLRLAVGVSVGVATYGVDGHTVDELLRSADQAMYAAKASGSGQWRASSPADHEENERTLRLLAEIESGRVIRELTMHYQPQVDLDGRIVGFEALARWEHPVLGTLPPRQFIPLAERAGLMGPITEAILDRALADLPRLQASAPGAHVSLNVTRRDVLGISLADDLRRRVHHHGLAPSDVVLEITEPVTRVSTDVAETFAALSRRGFEVSIRGFGTARSSLTALWSNPAVREVKLDPSIVEALRGTEARGGVGPTDEDAEAVRLLRALTSAAHGLGIRVVAEGVEDRESMRALRDLRCDVLQGYWVCPPADLGQIEVWCLAWPARSRELLR